MIEISQPSGSYPGVATKHQKDFAMPSTGFSLFCEKIKFTITAKLRKENPDLKGNELLRKAADICQDDWTLLADDEKQSYEQYSFIFPHFETHRTSDFRNYFVGFHVRFLA